MPLAVDVYVWLTDPRPETFRRFIDRYADDRTHANKYRQAFERTYISGSGTTLDERSLADLKPAGESGAFTLHMGSRHHQGAMITLTVEGAAVLGLSIDDPDSGNTSPATFETARQLIRQLREEFRSPAGIGGCELAPPHSRADWFEDSGVQIREGGLPPATP